MRSYNSVQELQITYPVKVECVLLLLLVLLLFVVVVVASLC